MGGWFGGEGGRGWGSWVVVRCWVLRERASVAACWCGLVVSSAEEAVGAGRLVGRWSCFFVAGLLVGHTALRCPGPRGGSGVVGVGAGCRGGVLVA